MDTNELIQSKVIDRFGIDVDKDNVDFVHLDPASAKSLEPSNYPVMTVVWQAIAFIKVSIHAVGLQPCDIFIDTMGVGFGYPFVKILFGAKIYSYTHYPTMSTDMLNDVRSEKAQFNNKNTHLKQVKLAYYNILILFYKWCGLYADQVAANSSWTRGHMDSLW
jgi:alpha-1,2-mannosyltransferase